MFAGFVRRGGRNGRARSRVEWSGAEWSGAEPDGAERDGAERDGAERDGTGGHRGQMGDFS